MYLPYEMVAGITASLSLSPNRSLSTAGRQLVRLRFHMHGLGGSHDDDDDNDDENDDGRVFIPVQRKRMWRAERDRYFLLQ